jgi:ribonuclease HI
MLFCKGTASNVEIFSQFFARYAQISGQLINPQKSTLYAGAMSQTRVHHIAHSLGFSVGTLPFLYLGVPIFKGKPKVCHFLPIIDKIKLKLAAWKASLLSYAGRVQLVKSVIQSMVIYSISVYAWPVSLIKELEKYIRNFIWSGDLNVRKMVTVPWHIVCTPLAEGGLGVRSLSVLNQAANLKLCWDLISSSNQWAAFLRSRVVRGNGFINHHIYSFIWSSIKPQSQTIIDNTCWLLGNGERINFWLHNWSGNSLVNLLNIPPGLHKQLTYTVSDYFYNNQWYIPMDLQTTFPQLLPYLNQQSSPLLEFGDQVIWKHSTSGDLSLKDAYSFFTQASPKVSWAQMVWNNAIPPSKSFMVWRLFHNKLATDENLAARGFQLPSMCSLCNKQPESSIHLFLQCPFALTLWNWLASIINHSLNLNSFSEILDVVNRGWHQQCKVVITAAVIYIFNVIWLCRNNFRFKGSKPNMSAITSMIIANVSLVGNLTSQTAGSSIIDFGILKFFKINIHFPKAPKIIEVLWQPPLHGWYKCNTDGTSLGNPGQAACAGIFRNHKGEHIGCFAQNIGVANALYAEIMGVIIAVECALARHWNHLWLECDSKLVTLALKSPQIIPWQLKLRWTKCMSTLHAMNFIISHIYREGNHCADKLAAIGLTMTDFTWWDSAPVCIWGDLAHNRLGLPQYRFG